MIDEYKNRKHLTANQIKRLDELTFDREANDNTLKIAMTHHANRHNELIKESRAMWEDLAQVFGLDLNAHIYHTVRKDGFVYIDIKEDK